jgi:Sec-independent protein secretion pathway component TatC
MLMLSVPMVLFYEISIIVGSIITRRRARSEAAA